jgi:alkaline phosphatase
MKYVDGYVLCVPKKNLPAYRRMAKAGAKIWRKYGALEYLECVGDEIGKVPFGMSFVELAKPKRGETVVFSWIVYKSKADRDRINAKVVSDMQRVAGPMSMPFDDKRMAWGGFKVLVEG